MTQWSSYQEAVFDFFAKGEGHGAIDAVAGSGKSTTAVEAITRADQNKNIIILAFNKHIETEFNAKLEQAGIFPIAKTYNAFGWGILRNNCRTSLKATKNEDILRYDVLGKKNATDYFKFSYNVKRVVSILKNSFVKPSDYLSRTISSVIDDYGIDIKEKDRDKFIGYCDATFRKSVDKLDISDFDDQKYQPIYRSMDFPKQDLAVVDEYQDTCPLEGKILEAIDPGRLIVFGDPYQAIYSFKGTEKDSITTFVEKYKATALPLSICYRCPKEVIREAAKIVPHIEYHPDAPEGKVQDLKDSEFFKTCTNDDMVLGRCNVDLVSSAMRFIRNKIPAYVKGKEVGSSLLYLLKRITDGKDLHIEDFTIAFRDYRAKEMESLKGRNAITRIVQFEETCETIDVISEGCTSSKQIARNIETLFSDEEENGILHQSIHKAKGGEGKSGHNVNIVRPDKIPHPKALDREEEMRIKYVGITRVKGNGSLNYVIKS